MKQTLFIILFLLLSSVLSGVDLMTYLPSDTMGIIRVNVGESDTMDVFRAALLKEIQTDRPETMKMLDNFKQASGIDILHKLQELVVSFKEVTPEKVEYSLCAKIPFDKIKLNKYLEARNAVKEKNFYSTTDPKGEKISVTFPEEKVILLGSYERIQNIIDFKGKNSSSEDSLIKDFQSLSQNKLLSGCLKIPDSLKQKMSLFATQSLSRHLVEMKAILFYLDFHMTPDEIRSVDFYLEAPLGSSEGAQELSNALKQYLQFARLYVLNQKPEAVALLDAIKVGTKKNTVRILLKIQASTVKNLKSSKQTEEGKNE